MGTKQFKHNTESTITLSQLMLPSHSNFGGKIHGGYILSLMDQLAFACATKHSGHYCVTASVASVDFLNPIEIGDLVTMKAKVNYVGKSSMIIGIRVESENIRTGKIDHCNSSFFTMVAKDDNGNRAEVPGLLLKSKIDVRRFVQSAKRMELKKERKRSDPDENFNVNNYLKELKEYRVKIEL